MEPIWISLLAALISALIASLISAVAALVRFSAKPRLRWTLDILFLLPLAIPALLANVLCLVGYKNSTLFWTDVIFALPLFYLCAIMGIRRVNREVIDAARLQGCGGLGIFRHVFLPVAWPWLAAGLALGLVRAGILLALAHA